MNTTECAKLWGVSVGTVRAYLKEGLNPYAYKERKRWVIPDNAPKPPTRRTKLVRILQDIIAKQEGVTINKERVYGMSFDEIEYTYAYLLDFGFIFRDTSDYKVTERGEELIRLELISKGGVKKTNSSFSIAGKLGTDGAGINGSYSLNVEKTSN